MTVEEFEKHKNLTPPVDITLEYIEKLDFIRIKPNKGDTIDYEVLQVEGLPNESRTLTLRLIKSTEIDKGYAVKSEPVKLQLVPGVPMDGWVIKRGVNVPLTFDGKIDEDRLINLMVYETTIYLSRRVKQNRKGLRKYTERFKLIIDHLDKEGFFKHVKDGVNKESTYRKKRIIFTRAIGSHPDVFGTSGGFVFLHQDYAKNFRSGSVPGFGKVDKDADVKIINGRVWVELLGCLINTGILGDPENIKVVWD